MARTKSNGTNTRTATIGFEATALRDSAFPRREAILRSLRAAKDNLCLPTPTFELHPSNFASLPGQLFYSTQIPVCLVEKLGIAAHYENN